MAGGAGVPEMRSRGSIRSSNDASGLWTCNIGGCRLQAAVHSDRRHAVASDARPASEVVLGHLADHHLVQGRVRQETGRMDRDRLSHGLVYGTSHPQDAVRSDVGEALWHRGGRQGLYRRAEEGRGHGRAVVLVAVERAGDSHKSRAATRKDDTHSTAEVGRALREVASCEARLITDDLPAYRSIGREMAEHHVVDHGRRKFSLGNGIHVNSAEGFIGMFRRTVQGTWHWISHKHVEAYTEECAWRHGRSAFAPMERFADAFVGLVNGPVGYRELTA